MGGVLGHGDAVVVCEKVVGNGSIGFLQACAPPLNPVGGASHAVGRFEKRDEEMLTAAMPPRLGGHGARRLH